MKDPKCQHSPTMRVSSHEDLSAAAKTSDPIASTYCCDRPACRQDATEWVQALAARPAVVVPLPQRRARAS